VTPMAPLKLKFNRMMDLIPFKKSRSFTESSPMDTGENVGSAGPDPVGDNVLVANILDSDK